METDISKYLLNCIRCLLPLSGAFLLFCSTAAAMQIIVDNRDANTISRGDWWANRTHAQNWGPDSLISAIEGSDFIWLPDVAEAGDYAVYARWTRNNKRSQNVKYFINNGGTKHRVTVNQRDPEQGGRWVLLGTYPLDAGVVRIRVTGTDGLVSADAVLLVKREFNPQRGFTTVSESAWDETAVRKVLHAFAYGGRADDAQIATWADMAPEAAITEMLTFYQHNLLLAPVSAADYDRLDRRAGTLRGLSDFWSSNAQENGVPSDRRWRYQIDGNSKYEIGDAWVKAATSAGLNPFRQKIGLWETNYHMATHVVNLGSFNKHMMVRYYDDIMNAHEQGLPYQDVITVAATSAAVAKQYGHFKNVYVDGICFCNEDFAREYHQLFYGILGNYDHDYHETVAIKNTAKALTDMSLSDETGADRSDVVTFGTTKHFPGVLDIINVSIGGSTALEAIDELSQFAINHPESLDNLPVKIIGDLADDNLTDEKIQRIREAWAQMPEKNLLDFLRAYAVSEMFHSENRIKYLTSIDRHMLIANKVLLNNEEGYLRLYDLRDFGVEGAKPFYPSHIVFGGQTGIEAADSADVFRLNYNRVAAKWWRYVKAGGTEFGRDWEKDWGRVIPPNGAGEYGVKETAEWLWDRFMADGLKHMAPLERGHLYALLGAGLDLGYLADPGNPQRIITSHELATDPGLAGLLTDLAGRTLALNSDDTKARAFANEKVGQAINFIVASPYIFVQEGR